MERTNGNHPVLRHVNVYLEVGGGIASSCQQRNKRPSTVVGCLRVFVFVGFIVRRV
jgi:hypothetical protein